MEVGDVAKKRFKLISISDGHEDCFEKFAPVFFTTAWDGGIKEKVEGLRQSICQIFSPKKLRQLSAEINKFLFGDFTRITCCVASCQELKTDGYLNAEKDTSVKTSSAAVVRKFAYRVKCTSSSATMNIFGSCQQLKTDGYFNAEKATNSKQVTKIWCATD